MRLTLSISGDGVVDLPPVGSTYPAGKDDAGVIASEVVALDRTRGRVEVEMSPADWPRMVAILNR